MFSLILLQNYLEQVFDYEAVTIFSITETVYKYVANTNATAHGQKMMMNTQITLDIEEVRKFVGDFNKLIKDLEEWTSNAVQIETWKDHFLKEYPKIFNDSSENEVEMDIDTTMETKPAIDREEKLRKVEEKLLSNKSNEKFTDYFGVINYPNLTPTQKITYFQKGVDDSTRRKICYASLQRKVLEECFQQSKKVFKETLEETKITRRWVLFLRKLHKLVLNYSQLNFCTVPLPFLHCNFKIIEEICKRDKEGWK